MADEVGKGGGGGGGSGSGSQRAPTGRRQPEPGAAAGSGSCPAELGGWCPGKARLKYRGWVVGDPRGGLPARSPVLTWWEPGGGGGDEGARSGLA